MTTTRATRMPAAPTRPAAQPRWLRIVALLGAVAYCTGISTYLLTHGGWPTPDYLIPPLLLAAVALGRGPAFLLIILAWQASAGIAEQLGRPVHFHGPLAAERALFGGAVPTVELQRWLYHTGRSSWYDWLGVLQHAAHFVLPVIAGFWLWLGSRRLYWRYLASVLVLFFAGFVTYALYPAAPPWMAGMFELTPPVHRIAVETVLRLPAAAPVGLAYTHMSPNAVAAIPSLHAALPTLTAFVLVTLRGRWALPLLLYPLLMGFYLVYLGEHYVIDVLLGFVYAVAAYLLVWAVPWARVMRSAPLPRPGTFGSGFALPRLTAGRAANVLGAALTPGLAIVSIAVILATLRTGRPAESGPLVPGLQVQAGDTDLLDPQPCGSGSSPSLTAGSLLLPVAGQYAAYLFNVDNPACYVLTANAQFPPPPSRRIPTLANRAPIRLRPLPSLREGVEYFSIYAGYPSEQLQARGFPAEQRFLLVAALSAVDDYEAAAGAVERLASLIFAPAAPPAPPIEDVPAEEVPPPAPPSAEDDAPPSAEPAPEETPSAEE